MVRVDREKFSVDTTDEWLRVNGTKFDKLELKDYGNEVRGCHTREDIADDETIIEVPLKCLITVEMGKQTEIGRAIIAANLDLDAPKHIFLMVFMLIDRKDPNSFFKPYYDILPATLSNMPIFWTDEELAYLEGSYMLEQIAERRAAIEADYHAICDAVPAFRRYANLEEFKWARMAVCSRNFGLIINGLQTAALVPYADMLNHYRPRETKWQFDDMLQSFTVISLQAIYSGAQVYDSYGRKCNHRFLLNYGFSVEQNIEPDGSCPNEVPILLELNPSDSLYEIKATYYRRDLISGSRRVRVAVGENENSKLLLAMLRLIVADQSDLEIFVASSGSSLYRSIRDAQIAVSSRNEYNALCLLRDTCKDLLSKYPHSLEEDCHRLLHGNVANFSNERNALIQVKGEKEVLHFYLDFALTGLSLLQVNDYNEFDRVLDNVRREKHSMIFYYSRNTLSRLLQDRLRGEDKRRPQSNVDLSKPTIV
eukprot:scaffold2312_cov165-Ochromonas_danica.AAC.44